MTEMSIARQAVKAWPRHQLATRKQINALRRGYIKARIQLGDRCAAGCPGATEEFLKMKIKQITFKIQTTDGVKEIDGYAVDTNLPIRLCVHPLIGYLHLIGWWSCSHYDTGLGINASKAPSMKKAIRRGVAEVLARDASGEIERVLDNLKNGRGLA